MLKRYLLEITVDISESLVELRGFKPMGIGGAVRSRAIPLFASQCAQPARGPRLDRDRRPCFGRSLLASHSGGAEVASPKDQDFQRSAFPILAREIFDAVRGKPTDQDPTNRIRSGNADEERDA
jgi:hypothetical protein